MAKEKLLSGMNVKEELEIERSYIKSLEQRNNNQADTIRVLNAENKKINKILRDLKEEGFLLHDVGEMKIKDSGERREFSTGAKRDISKGKGRVDLVPLSIISKLMKDEVLTYLSYYQDTGEAKFLYRVLELAANETPEGIAQVAIHLSKHFENGAKKYGEYNWQKGIPLHCYLDSAGRHYLKYKAGFTDEDHFIAFVWNIVCLIWTIERDIEIV